MDAWIPAAWQIAIANSYQVHEPEFVAWTVPVARFATSSTSVPARSRVQVGDPRWSSTTESGSPARARARIVSTKFLPPCPYNQAVRTIRWLGFADRTARSPASLL